MSDQKPLTGRAAIVTGATRGIGRAIALEIARRGADVAFNYAKSAEAAETLKSEIEALGVMAIAIGQRKSSSRDRQRLLRGIAGLRLPLAAGYPQQRCGAGGQSGDPDRAGLWRCLGGNRVVVAL
jgi:NAD(P)-dependent dehydrogenase (short-subunit alcohol dehydrogenase family)